MPESGNIQYPRVWKIGTAIVFIYFFFNSFLLPHGLLYTACLTPLFLYWLYPSPLLKWLPLFFLLTVPFMLAHWLNGIDAFRYARSWLMLFTVFVFCMAFRRFLFTDPPLEKIFRYILELNMLFMAVAVIILYLPELQERFWYTSAITPGVHRSYRMKLLTYEPSYYGLLLVPIVLYFYLQILLFRRREKLILFTMVTLPLILSFSFGIIGGLILSLVLVYVLDPRLLSTNPKLQIALIILLFLALIGSIILWVYFPDNSIILRIFNIVKGRDTSFQGRTYDSFYLGWEIAKMKSMWFGAGPGQTKVIGYELFSDYYSYSQLKKGDVSIPNSLGDTLASYGLIGLILRLAAEIVLFKVTKVFSNCYRLALFLFIFIYQFTGSFISNIVEYVIWIMAFYPPLFPQFNKENLILPWTKSNRVRGNPTFIENPAT